MIAHVSYIVDPAKLEALAGTDWPFLLSPLWDPLYIALIAATLAVTLAAVVICESTESLRRPLRHFSERLFDYRTFVPLFLRLALGIALIVAGTTSTVFLPNVPAPALGALEVVVGYCLLVGFMVRPCGLVALAIYVQGLASSAYLLGAMECAAAALLISAFGASRPSADELLGIDVLGKAFEFLWRPLREHAALLMRVALGSTLIWLAVTEKLLNPRVSEVVVLDYGLDQVVPVSSAMWVFAVAAIELAVGSALILGLYTRAATIITALILTSSFFFFREEVGGHVTFFGALLVLMSTGAGRWSLDAFGARRRARALAAA